MSQLTADYYAKRAVEQDALAMDATNSFERKAYERIADLYWQRAAGRNFYVCAPALSIVRTSSPNQEIELQPCVTAG